MTWTRRQSPFRVMIAVAAMLALMFTGVAAAPGADAAPKKPKVSWSYSPTTVRPGATVTVRYTVSKAPKRATVRLERKKGKKWVRVKTLKRGSGTTTFKAAKKGTRTYRIVVKSRKGKVLRASKKKITITQTQPKVTSMSLSATRVSEGQQITLRYGVTGVPKSATVKLQRAMGTAQAWTDVATLQKAAQAETTITAPTLGAHPYRIVVKAKKGHVLAASGTTRLYSYKSIPLEQIRKRGTDTVDIGGRLFRYAFSAYSSGYAFLSFDRTSCRSATFEAVSRTGTGTISAVQETADLQSFTLKKDEVTSGTFALSGDAVDFRFAHGTGYVYINGSLSCYTLDGKA